MERRQNVRFEMYRRLEQFFDTYRSRFPEASAASKLFAALSILVDALNEDAAARVSTQRAGRDQKIAAREALLTQLDAIARMAKVIARTTPGFAERFVLPRPKTNPVALATAHAFVKDAEPVAAQFIAHGLPADFIATLKAALETFERASEVRDAGKIARASARAGVRAKVAEGQLIVQQLDVIIRYHFAADRALLGAWERARQLDGLPQPPAAKAETGSPSAPSPADTATTTPADKAA